MTIPLKVVHVLIDTAHGPLSFDDMASGGRIVTGSEQAMLYLAKAQVASGHSVSMYFPTDRPGLVGGVNCFDVRAEWPRLRRLGSADVVISWVSSDPLRQAPASALRIYSLQINDWLLNASRYWEFVDVFVAVSESHLGWLRKEPGAPPTEMPWEVIPNGVDLSRFSTQSRRVPRRCVYLSSPDRGLHWLLWMWPEIRYAFPDAELHVFYAVQSWLDGLSLVNSEVGLRAKYVLRKRDELASHGVIFRGGIAPVDLARELAMADVLLYPYDPVRPTEGFGSAVLEACAAGVVPVITDADALGEVYETSGAVMVHHTGGGKWVDSFLDTALSVLKSDRDELREGLQTFAKQFEWALVAEQWAECIQRGVARKHVIT